MIVIDGACGEGGGQILRTALALSLVTQTPCRIERIRAKRQKLGLMRQHLTAVQAAAQIGAAEVDGMKIGSPQLTFKPKGIKPGAYTFQVGTAGSTMLVLQTLALAGQDPCGGDDSVSRPRRLYLKYDRNTIDGGTLPILHSNDEVRDLVAPGAERVAISDRRSRSENIPGKSL